MYQIQNAHRLLGQRPIRTAPRAAMMALSGRRDDLAAAVGVHRRLLSAVALGALWTWSGADAAVVVSAAALTVGVVVALLPIGDGRDHAATA